MEDLREWIIKNPLWNKNKGELHILIGRILGQTDFITNKSNHLRFDFDAKDDIKPNKEIIELFKDFCNDKYAIIHSHKGSIVCYIIENKDYLKYNYWNIENAYINFCSLPYILDKDYSGEGTISIIEDILRTIHTTLNKQKDTIDLSDVIYLNVPFELKDDAKKLGAKWDFKKRKWYAVNNTYDKLIEKYKV